MPTLSAIYRYPVKSTAGESLSSARVLEEGLEQDRRFMVVKPEDSIQNSNQKLQVHQVNVHQILHI